MKGIALVVRVCFILVLGSLVLETSAYAQDRIIQLDYEPKPALAGEPVTLIVSGEAQPCPEVLLEEGGVDPVKVIFQDGCAIFPFRGSERQGAPGSVQTLELFRLELSLGAFEVGEVSVVVYENYQLDDPIPHEITIPVIQEGCLQPDTSLCLNRGRFRVKVEWTDFAGNTGSGRAIPFVPEEPASSDTGFFWFFRPDNVELMVKVIDGCSVNQRFWVFVASGSTVGYRLMVEDTFSGVEKEYTNELGEIPRLIPDTGAFATCG